MRELLKPELWALDFDPDAEDAAALIQRRQGMVRASLGLYTTAEDIEALLAGLRDLQARPEYYRARYDADSAGDFHHRDFTAPAATLFDPATTLDRALARLNATDDML